MKGKSLVPGGFPGEFHQTFKEELKPTILPRKQKGREHFPSHFIKLILF